ncbi:asparagine synthase (glutamine-hydrolyzing) [soil metagenome]
MCGINGIMSLGGRLPAEGDQLIANMNRCIQHRGPDDTGIWSDTAAGIWLGHQRLSIIDLSAAGHQPMLNDQGNAIVFNGEIYNYEALKPQLKDYRFRSESDTEVLLELYSRKGHQTLSALNGMFAFAFWDKKKEELLIAKDRAGKKPLYYCIQNGFFAFSSEIKSLLSLPWIKPQLDDEALYHFLTFNQLSAPQTMFTGIKKLEPGFTLTINRNGIKEHQQYWEVNYTDYRKHTAADLEEKVFEALQKAVDYRMVADVPVGAFLSGGVDSSAVVALMRQKTSQTIKTYSIGFEGQSAYDELAFAQKVAKRYNTDHHEKIVKAIDIAEFLPHIVDIFDEPMADSTCIPIYFIAQLARKEGTIVVQTGDGADELFAGYRSWMKYYKNYPLYHQYLKLPSFLRKAIANFAGGESEESAFKEMLQRAAHQEEFFWGGARAFREHTKRSFLSPQWAEKMKDVNSYTVISNLRNDFNLLQKKSPWLGDLDWMCYLGFKQQIPWKYLYRMDKLGMANSIEIRSPFLDYELVNLALSIPPEMKIKDGEPKAILKKSLERILPNEILYRKKMGFNVPIREWAGDIMLDYVDANLHSFCSNSGIFDEAALKKQVQEIRKGNIQYTNNLWTVYFLMTWCKRWLAA